MDPFVSEIRIFGCNFAPNGWAQCAGQVIAISSNTALFSLIGITYGGNGTTTFGLPNLQGQAAIGQGQGPGLSTYVIGQPVGTEMVTLQSGQAGPHTHAVDCFNAEGTDNSPNNTLLATSGTDSRGNFVYTSSPGTTIGMNPQQLGLTGGGAPHNNMSPYLTLNYCIALQGVFPQRP